MRGHIKKYTGKRGTSWYAVVDLPPDPATGKRRQKRVSASTRRECEALVAKLLQSVESTTSAEAEKILVREYLKRWLDAASASLKPSTHRRYADTIRLHVLPRIGDIRMAKLSPLDVQRLYADRLAAGLSPTTVSNLHAMLHRAFDQAVRWGLASRNVTDMVDAPRRATPETQTWSAEQVAAVLAEAEKTELAALWRLALLTGMRRGEILGVKWEDIDLDRGGISVRRTLSRGKGGTWELGTPKTAAGRRSIALPQSVVDALRRHRVRQLERRMELGPLWQDQGFVFTNTTGGPLAVNVLDERFRKLTNAAGVPRIRFHDLRHTCATLMLANGEHPKIVAERLGHSDVGITLNRYSHVNPDMQRAAADRLDMVIDAASRTGAQKSS